MRGEKAACFIDQQLVEVPGDVLVNAKVSFHRLDEVGNKGIPSWVVHGELPGLELPNAPHVGIDEGGPWF
jgi:hypothetical protein